MKGVTSLDLKAYPASRASGVEWLGKVPAHWDIRRMKTVLDNVIQQPSDIGKVDLYVGMENVESWTGRLIDIDQATAFDSQCKAFEAGDILFGKLRPYLAKVVKANRQGVCVGEFLVLRGASGRAYQDYMEYLLRSKPVISEANSRTYGARMPRTNWVFLSMMQIPLPAPGEQVAIARFLDWVDERVKRLVEAKEKLVGLLEELRLSTISEAVTGQIDVRTGQPYPAYKHSGIEWLGSIPVHWELVPNKAMLRKRKALVGDKHAEFRLLSLTKRGVIKRDVSTGRGKFSADMSTFQEVRQGDLVFCLFDVPETPRTVGLSRLEGMITGAYTIFECKNPLLASFLEAFYIAMDDRKLLSPLYSGLRNTIAPPRFWPFANSWDCGLAGWWWGSC